MERPGWIAPLYGYAVCLVAVITILVNTASLIDASFERSNPLQGREGMSPWGGSLTSFEAFRATYNEPPSRAASVAVAPGGAPGRTAPAAPDTLSTAELRARYEALRADRIARVTFAATKDLIKSALLLVLSVALFLFHWRWVRSQRTA